MLFPSLCGGCGRAGPSPCQTCWARLRPAPDLGSPPGIDAAWSLLSFEGPARNLVARIKYRNQRQTVRWLADGCADLVRAAAPEAIDVVTFIPTAVERRRARGFDHAALLSRALARRLGIPARRLLRRMSSGAQTGRSINERRRGPAFAASHPLAGDRVLVVDDVLTTGASAGAAARALRAAGAASIYLVTTARTPLKSALPNADHSP